MNNLKVSTREMEWGGRKLVLETGKVAKQATGAVVVTYGETKVLATVCAAKEAKADQDFFPLTVNYQEKYYATGKVPGGFMKREGKPSEHEVLVSRLIDRPIRPLFPDAFKKCDNRGETGGNSCCNNVLLCFFFLPECSLVKK